MIYFLTALFFSTPACAISNRVQGLSATFNLYFPMMAYSILLIIVVEALFLHFYLPTVKWKKLITPVSLANLSTLFIIVPVVWYVWYVVYLDFVANLSDNMLLKNIIGAAYTSYEKNILVSEWSMTFVYFIFSCFLEYKIAKYYLKECEICQLKKAIIWGNVASYLLMMIFETIWRIYDNSYLMIDVLNR